MSDQQEIQTLNSNLSQASNLLDKINPTRAAMRTQTQRTTPTPTVVPKFGNITSLPTFAQRGEAIAKRLESVKADPKYKALSPEHQEKVRADLYKKYVPASYGGFHLPVPDEKTWVEASGRDLNVAGKDIFTAKKLSESYKDTKGQQLGEDFYAGVDKAYSNMTLFGAHITNKAFSAIFDLDKHYSHANETMLEKALPSYNVEKTIQRKLQNTEDAYRSRVQSDDFWLQTHPRDTVIGKLSSDAGELVATLPLYEALGAALPGDAVAGAK